MAVVPRSCRASTAPTATTSSFRPPPSSPPANLDPVRAAAVWMAYITAYGPLIESGRVRPGDHVLITAASSSVGLAAIQIARHIGAIPVATTRGSGKRQRLLDAGAAHVIVTDEEDLPARVKEITGGEGVRLAFDPVAGPGVETVALAIAPGGQPGRLRCPRPRPTPLPNAHSYPELTSSTYTLFTITKNPERLRRAVAFINAAWPRDPSTRCGPHLRPRGHRRGPPIHGGERPGRQDRRHRGPRRLLVVIRTESITRPAPGSRGTHLANSGRAPRGSGVSPSLSAGGTGVS